MVKEQPVNCINRFPEELPNYQRFNIDISNPYRAEASQEPKVLEAGVEDGQSIASRPPGARKDAVSFFYIDASDTEARTDRLCSCSKVEVKMIDFARVFPPEGVDSNYLEGLNSLMRHLETLLQSDSDPGGHRCAPYLNPQC